MNEPDFDPASFDPETIDPPPPAMAIGETVPAEGTTIGESIQRFVERAIPFIRMELKRQKRINPKKRHSFKIDTRMQDSETNSRVEAEISVEVFHPILHAELYLKEVRINEIYLPALDDAIFDGVNLVLDRAEAIKAEQLAIMEKTGKYEPHMVIAGSREVYKIIDPGHIMQIVVMVYPGLMKSVPNLLNHFFRSTPPIDPAKN